MIFYFNAIYYYYVQKWYFLFFSDTATDELATYTAVSTRTLCLHCVLVVDWERQMSIFGEECEENGVNCSALHSLMLVCRLELIAVRNLNVPRDMQKEYTMWSKSWF